MTYELQNSQHHLPHSVPFNFFTFSHVLHVHCSSFYLFFYVVTYQSFISSVYLHFVWAHGIIVAALRMAHLTSCITCCYLPSLHTNTRLCDFVTEVQKIFTGICGPIHWIEHWIEQGLTSHRTHYRSYRGRKGSTSQSVRPCSRVFRYKTLYLWRLWPTIHCKNWSRRSRARIHRK